MTHVARKTGLLRRVAPRNDEDGSHRCSRHRHARAAVPDLIENGSRNSSLVEQSPKTSMAGSSPAMTMEMRRVCISLTRSFRTARSADPESPAISQYGQATPQEIPGSR
jgi:hypothetical protein